MNYYLIGEKSKFLVSKNWRGFARTPSSFYKCRNIKTAKNVITSIKDRFRENLIILSDSDVTDLGYESIYDYYEKVCLNIGYSSCANLDSLFESSNLVKALNKCKGYIKNREVFQKMLDECNFKQQDLLHMLEFYDLDENDELNICKELKKVRQKRRELQIKIDIARELTALGNGVNLKNIQSNLSDIENRVYIPKYYCNWFAQMEVKYGKL